MYRVRLLFLAALLLLCGASLAHASYISDVSSHPDLVASWRLGESGGTTAAEVKGVSPGIYTNFSDPADYGRPGAIAGDSNTAAYFDGSNNYIDAGNHASLNGAWPGVTLAAWINPDDVNPGFRMVLGKWAQVAGHDHFGLWQGGTSMLIAVGDGVTGEGGMIGVGNVPLVAGQYNFVAGTWDASTRAYRLYVNGQLDNATGIQTGNGLNTNSATTLKIGTENASGFRIFKGVIDEPAIFDRVLTAQEILDLYNAGIVPEPGSLAVLAAGAGALLIRRRSRGPSVIAG